MDKADLIRQLETILNLVELGMLSRYDAKVILLLAIDKYAEDFQHPNPVVAALKG